MMQRCQLDVELAVNADAVAVAVAGEADQCFTVVISRGGPRWPASFVSDEAKSPFPTLLRQKM